MGVAGEIGKHGLGPGERFLSEDRPVRFVERLEIGVEGSLVGKRLVVVEEPETTVGMRLFEALKDQAPEQMRQHAHRQEEVRPARDPSGFPSIERPPPGTIMWMCG